MSGERRDEDHDRPTPEEEDERRAETERRGEQLREAWRRHHPQKESGKPKNRETVKERRQPGRQE